MLRIVKRFAPWILFDCFEESFYIHWSVGRSPRVHEVNPGRDPSKVSITHEKVKKTNSLNAESYFAFNKKSNEAMKRNVPFNYGMINLYVLHFVNQMKR